MWKKNGIDERISNKKEEDIFSSRQELEKGMVETVSLFILHRIYITFKRETLNL